MTFFDESSASEAFLGVPHDETELGYSLEIVASRATSSDIAASGQGGGTVTSLLLTAMERGFIDAAVLTTALGENGFPRGIVATTPAEITACAGSKFVGAHTLTALKEALDRGFNRIGVVAVPCQVRSVRKMALYDLKSENLRDRLSLVIGLFCNWAFSARDFVSTLTKILGDRKVLKADIPPPPANMLNLETEAGIENIPLDELRPIIQAACQYCPDMTSEFADVSVGMYEGRPGWNTLIVRSEVGRRLVEAAVAEKRIETDVFPETNLGHLKQASLNKKRRLADNG
jgi:coenzyme F420 hydrogenase subunit beta